MMTSAIGRRAAPPAASPTARRRAGFTLFELCLVMSLIGMIASLSWPAMRRYARSISDRASALDEQQQRAWAREKISMTGRED